MSIGGLGNGIGGIGGGAGGAVGALANLQDQLKKNLAHGFTAIGQAPLVPMQALAGSVRNIGRSAGSTLAGQAQGGGMQNAIMSAIGALQSQQQAQPIQAQKARFGVITDNDDDDLARQQDMYKKSPMGDFPVTGMG